MKYVFLQNKFFIHSLTEKLKFSHVKQAAVLKLKSKNLDLSMEPRKNM